MDMMNAFTVRAYPTPIARFPKEGQQSYLKTFKGSVIAGQYDHGGDHVEDVDLKIHANDKERFDAFNYDAVNGVLYLPLDVAQQIRELTDITLRSLELRNGLRLEPIEGVSEKQIAYATRVRQEILLRVIKAFYVDRTFFDNLPESEFARALSKATSARIWLDMLDPDLTDRGRVALVLENHVSDLKS